MLIVCPDASVDCERFEEAKRFAERHGYPWKCSRDEAEELALVFATDRLELHARAGAAEVAMRGWLRPTSVDFGHMDVRSGAGRRNTQPLAKALGMRRRSGGELHVLDATAGFAEDTWLCAAFGCRVTAVERSPIIAAMLRDGLARAHCRDPEIAARITLLEMDACNLSLAELAKPVDVVYLDPMFPERKGSARERKAMRILRKIVGEDSDALALFAAAKSLTPRRIIVKRPRRAEPLFGKPTVIHRAKSLRYDVYMGPSAGAD